MTRDELIEAMARAQVAGAVASANLTAGGWDEISETARRHWVSESAAALPVAVEAVLARIEALHRPIRGHEWLPTGTRVAWDSCACGVPTHSACPTNAEVRAIRVEWGQQP